jgi:hypothetical protein
MHGFLCILAGTDEQAAQSALITFYSVDCVALLRNWQL